MSTNAPELLRAPVECIVTIDDREITDLYPYLRSVEVQMSRRAAATCTLVFDTFRDEQGDWLIEDDEQARFRPWKRIDISAAFAEHTAPILKGYIKEINADHPQDMSASKVTIRGQDTSILFDREHVRKVWSSESEQLADGRIAAQIAEDKHLGAEVEEGLGNSSLNQNGTSISFLKARAEANGFELFFRDEILHFHPPKLNEAVQPTITVYAGAAGNCLSFSVRYDGHKPDRVRVVRASETSTASEGTVYTPDLALLGARSADSESMGLPGFEWTMDRPQGATRAEVDARAQAAANKNAWKLEATGELDGALYGHVLLTHQTVAVDGVGETYGGKYYVDEVTHVFSQEGYRERFKLLRNAIDDQR